jgi:hypothetical protein
MMTWLERLASWVWPRRELDPIEPLTFDSAPIRPFGCSIEGEGSAEFLARLGRERKWCERGEDRATILEWNAAMLRKTIGAHTESHDNALSQLNNDADLTPSWGQIWGLVVAQDRKILADATSRLAEITAESERIRGSAANRTPAGS